MEDVIMAQEEQDAKTISDALAMLSDAVGHYDEAWIGASDEMSERVACAIARGSFGTDYWIATDD